MKYLVLVMVMLCGSAQADSLDKYRLSFALLMAADRIQTSKIVASENAYEVNIALGRNPSIRKQNIYFASTYAAITAASYWLPRKWRKPALIAVNVIQIGAVSSNLIAGFSIAI